MKRRNKLMLKQLIKYFLIVIVALTGLFLGRVIWNLPSNYTLYGLLIGGSIILVSLILDAISVRDIIPIFKG